MSAHDRHLDGPEVICDDCGCDLGRHADGIGEREDGVRLCDECFDLDYQAACTDCDAVLYTQDDHHHLGTETHPLCGTCGGAAEYEARQARALAEVTP